MDSENSTTSEVPVKKRGRKPGRRGRPKGSTTKVVKKRRGRKRGRPKVLGVGPKPVTRRGRRGRSSATSNNLPLSNGIHLIGGLLVVDTNVVNCNEVIFIGKAPKIR